MVTFSRAKTETLCRAYHSSRLRFKTHEKKKKNQGAPHIRDA